MSAAPVMQSVRWAELRPDDFRSRLQDCPVVYLPMGLCEPHGHVAALGLDLIKAEYFCEKAARRFGGIVAPAQGYHIHECGFHARWLEEVVGNENPMMAALPPDVMLRLFLYQLRAFANTGFRAVVAISGHGGGSQFDLRRVGDLFSSRTGVAVVVKTDAEFVDGLYTGDHAGRFEISQLMAIRPDLVDLSLIDRQHVTGSGGRLALGGDAAAATAEYGRTVNEAILESIGKIASSYSAANCTAADLLTYAQIDALWADLARSSGQWRSAAPARGQPEVSPDSRWRHQARLTGSG